MKITGLHHITAVTAQASANLRFYTKVLGLRLVKKTVNQDDVSAYHLFYADAVGTPGTDMTFFDWPQAGKRQAGTDSLTLTLFRVDGPAALAYWTNRFNEHKVHYQDNLILAGRRAIFLTDVEGQQLALVDDGGEETQAQVWSESGIPQEFAIKGFQAIRMAAPQPELVQPMLELLGFDQGQQLEDGLDGTVMLYGIDGGGPGKELQLAVQVGQPSYISTAGSIHHVAWRVADELALQHWQHTFDQHGISNSGIIDRFYFRSLYFRISPGILFELATDGPGFTQDEPVERLGQQLSLPPFLEAHRAEIEAGLRPI